MEEGVGVKFGKKMVEYLTAGVYIWYTYIKIKGDKDGRDEY